MPSWPKSLVTRSCVSPAVEPAPTPQPASAAAARATARTPDRRRRARALGNGEHHPRRAAGEGGRPVTGLVDHLQVQDVASAAELGRQQVAEVLLGADREVRAAAGAALPERDEALLLAVVARAAAAVVARQAHADVGQAGGLFGDVAPDLPRALTLLVLLALGHRGEGAI